MKKFRLQWQALSLLAASIMFGGQQVLAVGTISYDNTINPAVATHLDATNYSPTGLDLGNAGFWFANFNASAPNDGTPDANHANSLPGWVLPNFDPLDADYTFGTQVFSRGGNNAWSSITLPDGTTGLSGAILDPEAAGNSNNSVPRLLLGPGTPADFWMHIVTDNTNNQNNSVNRIRARAEDEFGLEGDVNLRNLTYNGVPDVYSFRYTGWVDGDIIKLQLNSGVAGVSPSIAGIMFDVIPEPSGVVLLGLGSLIFSGARRRRS